MAKGMPTTVGDHLDRSKKQFLRARAAMTRGLPLREDGVVGGSAARAQSGRSRCSREGLAPASLGAGAISNPPTEGPAAALGRGLRGA
eukprot:3150340-Pyramimonas_sp.AAC.1